MHPHRVQVLDRADDDDVVGAVAHHLKFVLFPAADRFFDQHFCRRRSTEARFGDAAQLALVIGEPTSDATHGVRGSHHQRIAEFLCRHQDIIHRVTNPGLCHFGRPAGDVCQTQADLLELLAIFTALNRLY